MPSAAKAKRIRYRVKPGAPISSNKAQVYGECLQELSERYAGRLNAETVVREAKNPRCPIHDFFEWNDRIAAEEYRKVQARDLMRCIVYVEEETGKEVRAFMNVDIGIPQDDMESGSYYVPTAEVLSNGNLMAQVLEEAVGYLKWFRQKYALLRELSEVHSAIDRTVTTRGPSGRSPTGRSPSDRGGH